MIRISNVYHMLAYAFRSLNDGGVSLMGNEEFENLHELFAEIIISGMRKQLKRGLPRRYASQSEELQAEHSTSSNMDLSRQAQTWITLSDAAFCGKKSCGSPLCFFRVGSEIGVQRGEIGA